MKIAIAGCLGRMGQTLITATLADERFTLAAGSEQGAVDAARLAALGASHIFITPDVQTLVNAADAVIDFTSPAHTLAIAEAVSAKGGIHIVGTTGFSAEEQKKLAGFAHKACIVQSGNFSLGVNLLERLVEEAARKLADDVDIEIFEMHHKHKKDAPSGTALMLGEAAARGRGVALADKKSIDRDGLRKPGDIGFSVARGGDVVGIHTVTFAGGGEVLELKHQGFSREIYAKGALAAAFWAKKQKPGLYSMRDVLN
ncbi:MAG: 4-hydroxy-tetrahydrodipicolinate reductase [Alphaproteobacteria bacterium]|nr:4-hydroxy-tetrahydrodipicolinate reductase [Alphaproteobacteria bacterium]